MEVYECLKSRRTVRRFRSDPVPDEVVRRILQAARWAPSSRNQQPWHLVVISDRAVLAKIGGVATSGSFIAEAPMAIAVIMDNADTPELDAGRALQQMELMAWSEGLGTCFVGLPGDDMIREIKSLLGVPHHLELITVMPFGYRQQESSGRGAPRKPLSQMAHRERFGQEFTP